MKLLRIYCNSENGLCKLFADTASLDYKMLVKRVCDVCVSSLFCLFVVLTAIVLLVNKVVFYN